MTRPILGCLTLAACLLSAAAAAAQQRPLVTEDPETIGAGLVLLEGGFDYGRDLFLPASGLKGNLLRAPTLGVSFGISSIAELQIDGGFYNRFSVSERRLAPLSSQVTFTGTSTHDVEDIVLATKIRVLAETASHPAIGLRFATKLPNAGNESGLGLDTTDFHAQVLVGKTVQSIRFVGNVGLGILGDPTRGDNQNDVLDYGLSVARAIREGLEVVGELNGRANTRGGTPPVGTESRATLRVGGRLTRGTVRLDAGVLLGVTSRDPGFGFTAGATWVFKGFTVP
jgi:opacity protein-like surface antigen